MKAVDCERVHARVREGRNLFSLVSLKEKIGTQDTPRELEKFFSSTGEYIPVIAELLTDESILDESGQPVESKHLAQQYEAAGLAGICIFFREREQLERRAQIFRDVKRSVEIPLVYKDVIVDSYQIFEARAFGADAVQFVAHESLWESMPALVSCAHDLGMSVCIEVHTIAEVNHAVELGVEMLCVNASSPEFLQDPAALLAQVADHVPAGISCLFAVANTSEEEMRELHDEGADGMYFSEAVVTAHGVRALDDLARVRAN